MKLIKLLITMSLLNVIFVTGLSKYLSFNPVLSSRTPDVITITSEKAVPVPTPKPVIKAPPQIKAVATSKPVPTTPVPTKVPSTPTPAPKPSGCVIKIDGVSYEITSLRKSHSGGDIFSCGTDMSAIFWGRHNQKILQKMQGYRI